jgi:hypothetical protein
MRFHKVPETIQSTTWTLNNTVQDKLQKVGEQSELRKNLHKKATLPPQE